MSTMSGMSAMSAFALRRKMLQEAEAAAAQSSASSSEPPSGPKDDGKAEAVENLGEAAAEDDLSSLEGDEPEETPSPVSTPKRKLLIQRTTFQRTKQNFKRETGGSIRLKMAEGERLVILGSYGIVVSSGAVTVAGATLRASPKTAWVHAPQCHGLPVVRCTDDAAVTLKSHPAADGLRKMEQLAPVFGGLWNEQRDKASDTFQILYSPEDGTARSQGLVMPPEWNKLLSELATSKKNPGAKSLPAVYFVCGPKSSGKSTFTRLLTNRLLTEVDTTATKKQRRRPTGVAVLDVDPGQPEFGTPGSVSLVRVDEPNLSPPFCHPRAEGSGNQLLRAHDIASVTPADNQEHYETCVTELFSAYRRDPRCNRCPLVVNTPGWVLGTGLYILEELIKRMRPSQVMYMSQDGPEETIQGLEATYDNVPLVQLPSQPGDSAWRTAQHLRAMQTQSYFHMTLAPAPAATAGQLSLAQWDPTPLEAVRPWVVPYSGPDSGILGLLFYDSQPPPELLAEAINGTVVSVVAIERPEAFRWNQRAEPPAITHSPEGLPCIANPDSIGLDPEHSHTLGVALVRGIDFSSKTLLLLTPVAIDEAVDKLMGGEEGFGIVLVSGKLDQPTWSYTEELYRQQATSVEAKQQDMASLPYLERPWIEVLRGNEKRDVGSQVWRVRRDLGRSS